MRFFTASFREVQRPLICAAWFAILSALSSGAAETPSGTPPRWTLPVAERSTLVVGATSDSYPHAYIGPDGRWAGYSAEMLDAVAKLMGLHIRRVSAPGSEIQRRFREGEFDMMQTLSQTADREQFAEFSVPFLTLQGAVFVRKNNSPIKSLEDLNGRKFALIGRNSIGARFLRDHGLSVKIVDVSSVAEAVELVHVGECDATFASQLTTLSVIEKNKHTNVAMLGSPLPNYDIRHCFAVHKGDAQLLARLNEGLAILNSTGESHRIYDRWFGHLEVGLVSKKLVIRYAAIVLSIIALIALLAWFHQRILRRQITQQTREIAGQKALLQALYDNIPLAICLLQRDPDGFRILSINQQAEPWIGVPSQSVTGALLHKLPRTSEWLAQLADLLSAHTESQQLVREERHLSGARKRIILTLLPMTPAPSGKRRLCVLSEDVTERRTLDEEISQSRRLRAIGELVGGIAHEFNNLLTPITLKAGEIQLDWPNDTRLHAALRLISESAQRASDLTRRLLTFGRKTENRVEDVHLNNIVSACFALLKLTVDRRIVWDAAIPPDLPPLRFNPTDLNQIILNLVLNARDTLMEKVATRPAGNWTPTIRVEAQHLAVEAVTRIEPSVPSRRQILGWQRITVRDNGMGMTQEVRERAFEPFYTTKAIGKGTGLGLATVWHLVTEVSGRIEVESVPGDGTAFHVYLPMLQSDVATEPVTDRKAPLLPPPTSARVFVAEDDELVASAVCAALKRAAHTVSHEKNGAVAWEHLKERMTAYDLLILDVNMPGLDGIELAHRVRATGTFAGGILVISGRLDSGDLQHLAEAGVDYVLNKPFDIAEFLGAVRGCLRARPT